MPATDQSARLWEVDTLRGIAIVEMVIFHFVWDLHYFGLYQTNILSGPWQIFARTIAATFLFVLGLSLTLSYNRASRRAGQSGLFTKYLRRGAQIFGLGMIITGVTYFFIGPGYVVFGILHLLGLSIILAYPFLSHSKWLALLGGLLAIGAGAYLNNVVVSFPWLIWLGLPQAGRYMVDYYPLLPWFGLALLGVFVGYSLYPRGVRGFHLPDLSNLGPVRALRFLGWHSLLIYLIHQPILIGIFLALGYSTT